MREISEGQFNANSLPPFLGHQNQVSLMKLNLNTYMFLQQLKSFPANSRIRFPTRASGLPAVDGSEDVHEVWAEVA